MLLHCVAVQLNSPIKPTRHLYTYSTASAALILVIVILVLLCYIYQLFTNYVIILIIGILFIILKAYHIIVCTINLLSIQQYQKVIDITKNNDEQLNTTVGADSIWQLYNYIAKELGDLNTANMPNTDYIKNTIMKIHTTVYNEETTFNNAFNKNKDLIIQINDMIIKTTFHNTIKQILIQHTQVINTLMTDNNTLTVQDIQQYIKVYIKSINMLSSFNWHTNILNLDMNDIYMQNIYNQYNIPILYTFIQQTKNISNPINIFTCLRSNIVNTTQFNLFIDNCKKILMLSKQLNISISDLLTAIQIYS